MPSLILKAFSLIGLHKKKPYKSTYLTLSARQNLGNKDSLFSKFCWKIGYLLVKVKLNTCLTPYTKVNPKWNENLNVKATTIKLLEKIREQAHCYWSSPWFLDVTQKALARKARIDMWQCIRLQSSAWPGSNQQSRDKPGKGNSC